MLLHLHGSRENFHTADRRTTHSEHGHAIAALCSSGRGPRCLYGRRAPWLGPHAATDIHCVDGGAVGSIHCDPRSVGWRCLSWPLSRVFSFVARVFSSDGLRAGGPGVFDTRESFFVLCHPAFGRIARRSPAEGRDQRPSGFLQHRRRGTQSRNQSNAVYALPTERPAASDHIYDSSRAWRQRPVRWQQPQWTTATHSASGCP